jgi:hypothetical protein
LPRGHEPVEVNVYISEFIRRAAYEFLEKAGETEAASVFAADE